MVARVRYSAPRRKRAQHMDLIHTNTHDERQAKGVSLRAPVTSLPRPWAPIYANIDAQRRSPLPRRRRPRAEQHNDRYGEQADSIDPVSLSSDEMQGRSLRGVAGGLPSAAGRLLGRPRSQGDDGGQGRKQRRRRGDVGGGGREASKTWRGRLGGGSGADRSEGKVVEKGPSLPSGKKFEDLDNYLRGCASVSAAKWEKRKRRLGHGTGGGESYGGTTTDGSSLSLAERHEVRIGSARRADKRRIRTSPVR